MGEIKQGKVIEKRVDFVEVSAASSIFPGEVAIGDCFIVSFFKDGVLIGVIDGLGHGNEAAVAARTASDVLRSHAEEPIISLMKRCHEALVKTRGAAVTLTSFNCRDHTITWTGVGNVKAMLLHVDESFQLHQEDVLLRPGVVGYNLPFLRASIVPVYYGDLLIAATDGIQTDFSSDFIKSLFITGTAEKSAQMILSRYNKGIDDALVLVARYLGNA
jgi:serine phosphatase RsbU (regulator of sigma subunit)